MSNKLQAASDSIVGLERTRSRLEHEVSKLQKSLLHWQTWEAEYEGFREEIQALGDNHTNTELNKAGASYEGTLLNEKEVGLLLEDNKGRKRSGEQILSLLSNRIRYVHENVKAVGNLLENAQNKVVASQILSQPHVQNEEGLPLREIREELDDYGNVICSTIVDADEAAPRVAEALRKAGVNGVSETKPSTNDSFVALEQQRTVEQAIKNGGEKSKATHPEGSKIDNPKGTVSGQHDDLQASRKPPTKKKGVAFAEGTKKEDAPSKKKKPFIMGYDVTSSWDIPSHTYKPAAPGNTNGNKTAAKEYFSSSAECAKNVKEASLFRRATAAPVISSGNGEGASTDKALSPVVPSGESPEDGLLRHQMLKYNMEDVGAVVAEIDLEDGAEWSDEGDEDYDDAIDDEDDEEEDDEEDEFGRTKRRVIDDRYRVRMLELDRKLNQKVMQSSGREVHSGNLVKRNIGNEVVHDREDANWSDPSLIAQSAFNIESETQDLSSFDASQSLRTGQPLPQRVETFTKQSSNSSQSTKNVSRFKASRKVLSAEDTITPPTPPTTTKSKALVASNIIERPVPKSSPPIVVTQPNTSVVSSIVEKPPLPSYPAGVAITESNPYTPSPSIETNSSSIAVEPDGLDASLLQQQVATEYYRMRNRMIQRQGGFLASAEEESSGGVVRLDEGGGGKKVSRFKAARLSMK